jgi:hypothetical protein
MSIPNVPAGADTLEMHDKAVRVAASDCYFK